MKKLEVAVIGGGAAGYFAAIHCAEASPDVHVTIFEGTARPLTKVRISGGGRCNVTHHCFEPERLVKSYPRGHRELRGPFSRFQPKDTVAWYEARGVKLKAEDDGRMFPVTDDSQTIIDCLQGAARDAGVTVRLGAIVKKVVRDDRGFVLTLKDGEERFDRILLATGSAPPGHAVAKALGHAMVDPVPSLFTFNIDDPRLADLPGISFPEVELELFPEGAGTTFAQKGPLLITHWGLSGPAVLKLSAFAARELHAAAYRAKLVCTFLPGRNLASVTRTLQEIKTKEGKRLLSSELPLALPKRFAQTLVSFAGIDPKMSWANLTGDALNRLARELCQGEYKVAGKGVFKEEFVTAGGVDLKEVDFRTMESKRCSGLYFAGEILDIDGITGGFNFQAAWTTGFIAGTSMARA